MSSHILLPLRKLLPCHHTTLCITVGVEPNLSLWTKKGHLSSVYNGIGQLILGCQNKQVVHGPRGGKWAGWVINGLGV